jgi:hypothetical protein
MATPPDFWDARGMRMAESRCFPEIFPDSNYKQNLGKRVRNMHLVRLPDTLWKINAAFGGKADIPSADLDVRY